MTTQAAHDHSEAAIYAEGTPYTADDLLRGWKAMTAEERAATNLQTYLEDELRRLGERDGEDYLSTPTADGNGGGE